MDERASVKSVHASMLRNTKTFADIVAEGTAILRYQGQLVDRAVGHAGTVKIGSHEVPAVNATCLVSEIAGKLAEGKPFAAVYFQVKDGSWVYSLRSAPDGIDVSEVAKKYGGGGHAHAAGFSVQQPLEFRARK